MVTLPLCTDLCGETELPIFIIFFFSYREHLFVFKLYDLLFAFYVNPATLTCVLILQKEMTSFTAQLDINALTDT